jgi:pilus assembly protein CpaC
MLNVSGEDQVQLKITVAEVNRSLVKQLGLDWNATNIDIGSLVLGAATHLPIGSSAPNTITGTADIGDSGSLTVTLKALESTGMLRTLAEPTLTAISGESASFLAGCQFPYPTSDSNGGTTIAFKDFGVALAMTPVVLSDGRISLHVKTEVSQLSTENAVSGVPGLAVRRAESTLELPSGGAMVLGGLLQDSVRQTINNVPALGKLPILGALFRSRDFQRNETELVIIATPYLVKPVPRTALALPGQGFATPSDAQTTLFGSLNRIYGGASAKSGGKYQGHVGYIYE